ncbi:hypothetical protein Hypma_008424 [Hypsizygus marmoreus]|uniref:Uncharacterized protein n=1 Tax=Hypsizygus marmoreus TaxID=39966 RepID=A0A369JXI0_HYPMA|nr:hypothetical protein Hypma_008424 [Hypsizygus marmoreus]
MEVFIHYNLPRLHIDGLQWSTPAWILLVSFVIVYSVSAVGSSPPVTSSTTPRPRLAQAYRRKAEKAALIDLERRRRRILESWATDGFQFTKLPPELQLMILAYSADWTATYRSLVQVSRSMFRSTLRACIPHIPITLSTPKQLASFFSLLNGGIARFEAGLNVGLLVHRLWVTPLRKEDNVLGYRILTACTNVRVLACDARTLRATVARSSKLRHTMCRDLTLLLSRSRWDLYRDTPSGAALMKQLTHLRVMGEEMVPQELGLPNLTHLSFLDRPRFDGESEVVKPWPLGDRKAFPSLHNVVLTRRCGAEGLSPSRVDAKLVLLYFPREWTEMQIWCDSARGRSIWQLAATAHGPVKIGT